MKNEDFDLRDIKQVFTTSEEILVNEMLRDGWVLLKVVESKRLQIDPAIDPYQESYPEFVLGNTKSGRTDGRS